MRFKISLKIVTNGEFEPTEIPIRYHAAFLSLLKRGLEKASPAEFNLLFKEKNTQKNYSQALIFHKAKFSKEVILLKEPKISWFFSTPDSQLAFNVYNAFQLLKQEKRLQLYSNVEVIVDKIENIYQERITSTSAVFQTLSPILVRQHDPIQHKDWFLSFGDDNFEIVCKENLKRKLIPLLGERVKYDIDELKIKPLEMKKTVIKTYEKALQSSIGKLKLSGEPYLLEYLRDTSISSKSGLFFGYMEEI
ncbi:CRISPR-associated endoribonuclease Cas6 [Enterococcus sp. CSURQ0835]|uniref:CRISPR-associated endoribonuclease Cas6 n=1 Tax=Enterococcus sp. CSURQ0835 TaxID=2681394 RepID=UPI00135C2378|nr:CRISPR-associated endoribonuclease Cas6 [Enterococcus sp. CSURQ0835]